MIADHPSNAPQLKVNPTSGETERTSLNALETPKGGGASTHSKYFQALGSVHCILCLFLKFSQLSVVVTSYNAQKGDRFREVNRQLK